MSLDARGFAPPSQLLQRNEALLAADHILVAGMPADQWTLSLTQHADVQRISAFTTDFDVYAGLKERWARSGLNEEELHFGSSYPVEPIHDLIVLYARKGRDETDLLLRLLLPSLKPGGQVLLVGENKAGIKSQGRLLEPLGTNHKVDSARHCVLFSGLYENAQPQLDLNQVEKRYKVEVAGKTLTICTLPGVFSHGRLDDGTRLLLEQLENRTLSGSILDFGCGAGVIGAWILASAQKPVELTLLDNSALALEAARRTLAANDFKQATLLGSNGLSQVTEKYRFLVTNPPFHTGVKTNYQITEDFLRQMPKHLQKDGELWLVANSFLKYPPIIQQHLGHCHERVDNRRFAVYQGLHA